MTKQPIQASVSLYGDEPAGVLHSFYLGETKTNSDGTFSFKTPADRSREYYLHVVPQSGNVGDQRVYLSENKNTDIGDFHTGDYTFYCKVNLVPVTNSAIDFPYLPTGALHFNTGASTQFLTSRTFNYSYYLYSGPFFIRYRTYPSGIATDSTILIPITSPDTLNVTIQY